MMLRRLRPEEWRDRHMHQARVEPLDRGVREGGVLRGQSAQSPSLQEDVGRSEKILEGGEAGGGGEVEGDGALVGIEVEVVEAELVGRCCPLRGGAGSGTEAGEAMMGGSPTAGVKALAGAHQIARGEGRAPAHSITVRALDPHHRGAELAQRAPDEHTRLARQVHHSQAGEGA